MKKLTKKSITEAFNNASKDYVKKYKSRHWQNEYDNRDVEYKEDSLDNFRNNSLSDGLNRSVGTDKEFIQHHFNDLIQECGKEFVYSKLNDLNIGNNNNFLKLKDKFIEVSDNFHIKFLYDLDKYVFNSDKNINIVCEIGGGYGNLSKLIKSSYLDTKIILIDLPEANYFSSFYIQEHFPKAKILIYTKTNKKYITMDIIKDYDFIIIPPWIDFKDIKVDLFINTRSMMEMDYNVILEYFNLIHYNLTIGGYFFNVNKYYKDTVGHAIELDNYPYDDYWDVVLSQPSWKQESKIHELITKRLDHNSLSIKNELEKIKLLKLQFFKRKKYSFLFETFPLLVRLLKSFLPISIIKYIKKKIF